MDGCDQASMQDDSGGASSVAVPSVDDARRLHAREPQSPPPQKARRVQKSTGDDGRGRRPRKGDAKRARKAKALAQAAEMCQYFVDVYGLRRVRPYVYDFQTHAKERWLGRAVVDVFSAEFGANPRSYYERAIRCGLLTINGKNTSPDYKLNNSDLVCNRTHRHEPPVAGGDITIISESAEEVVVDKPCTVPIHPCGSYRFNTLFYILQHQRPDLCLRVCHRLDRLTSGLTILAKTAERAGVIQTQIGSGLTRKTYLARVSGKFGQNLPPDRRQPGSPSTFAAALSVQLAGQKHASTDNASGDSNDAFPGSSPGGGIASEEKENASVAAVAARIGDGSEPSPIPAAGDGEAPLAVDARDGPGELWWRFEAAGEGVVGDRTHNNGGAVGAGGAAVGGGADSCGNGVGAGCPSRDGGGKAQVIIRVNCPIGVLDAKDGVYECHRGGKEAQTVVRNVAYDAASDTSVVECTPVHGRTHQIRLHLQWIGHPIANDPCYGGELHFGNPEAKRRAEEHPSSSGWKGTSRSRATAATEAGAESAAAAAAAGGGVGVTTQGDSSTAAQGRSGESGHSTPPQVDLAACEVGVAGEGSLEQSGQGEGAGSAAADCPTLSGDREAGGAAGREAAAEDLEAQRADEDDDAFMVRTCSLCQDGERFKETQLHCVGIWLHALRYEGPDWAFETNMPTWAIL